MSLALVKDSFTLGSKGSTGSPFEQKVERTLWSRELHFLIAASSLSRDHRCQEQGLARFAAQRWHRLACRGTIPKVGALALRLRSSDIPTTHTITRSPMERTQGNDKMKHRSDSSSQNTQWEGRQAAYWASGRTHSPLAVSIWGSCIHLKKRWEAVYNEVRENRGFKSFL